MDPLPPVESPEALLDAIRAHPEWDETRRDEHLGRLVARVPADRLLAVVRRRLDDLGGADGEVLLRLVEAHATPALLRELAAALMAQPDLPPERAWDALALLDASGLLGEFPELAERWDELDEAIDEDATLDQLADQLEGDPEGTWLALQGLGAVEPDVRPQIVAGLARAPLGPGLIEFLRLLSFAHDPATRAAALDALDRPGGDDADLIAAWASIAAEHPVAEVSARARAWLGDRAGAAVASWSAADRPSPHAGPGAGHRARRPGPGARRGLVAAGCRARDRRVRVRRPARHRRGQRPGRPRLAPRRRRPPRGRRPRRPRRARRRPRARPGAAGRQPAALRARDLAGAPLLAGGDGPARVRPGPLPRPLSGLGPGRLCRSRRCPAAQGRCSTPARPGSTPPT